MARGDGGVRGPTRSGPVVAVLWTSAPDDERFVETVLPGLSPEEAGRARRTSVSAARSEFATGAWLLRATAARLLGVDESEVVVDRRCASCEEPHGRPRIAGLPGFDASLTHSAGRVGLALAAFASVGLDVESVAGPPDAALVETACTPDEAAALDSSPADVRGSLFTHLWCRKESLLKAASVGLRVSPSEIDASGVRPVLRRRRSTAPLSPAEATRLARVVESGRWVALARTPEGFESALFATGSACLSAELDEGDVETLMRSDDYAALVEGLGRTLRS